jgi:hypothetical protein
MNKYHIAGRKENLDKLFEMTRVLGLITVSWPYEDDSRHGFIVQLSPSMSLAYDMLKVLCDKCNCIVELFKDKEVNMYSIALERRNTECLHSFVRTPLTEFAAGYYAALQNVKQYGFERVIQNAQSGIAK